jgi:hypothetical protein
MKRLSVIIVGVLVIGLVAFGLLTRAGQPTDTNWI